MMKTLVAFAATVMMVPSLAMGQTVIWPDDSDEPDRPIWAAVSDLFLSSAESENDSFVEFKSYSKPYKDGVPNCEDTYVILQSDRDAFGTLLLDAKVNDRKVTVLVRDDSPDELTECIVHGLYQGKVN